MLIYYLLTFLSAFLLTLAAASYARYSGMLDVPGDRHSHTVTTPRGGGLGIVAALLLASWIFPAPVDVPEFWTYCLLPGFVVLAVIGFMDDRRSLSALFRFFVQLAASFWLLVCFSRSGMEVSIWVWLLGPFFLVWMTNLYNFMDGSNGMAATQGVFAGLVLAGLFWFTGNVPAAMVSAAIAVACLGFLPLNIGKARVFMGDVGSISLGYLLAAMMIYGVLHQDFSVAVAWLVMLVFLCDSTLTLLTRVIRRERWYTPHKQHIYQRLIADGWSHGQVLGLYQSINLLLLVPVIGVAVSFPEIAEVIAISITLALAMAWFLALRKIGVLA
jgi:Fuc2NAc and GlcNAc transferase